MFSHILTIPRPIRWLYLHFILRRINSQYQNWPIIAASCDLRQLRLQRETNTKSSCRFYGIPVGNLSINTAEIGPPVLVKLPPFLDSLLRVKSALRNIKLAARHFSPEPTLSATQKKEVRAEQLEELLQNEKLSDVEKDMTRYHPEYQVLFSAAQETRTTHFASPGVLIVRPAHG